MPWICIFGGIIVFLLLIPNILYAFRHQELENKCKNKPINFIEQIGRYGAMVLMIFPLGVEEFGFYSDTEFVLWLLLMVFLLITYWGVWWFYFKKSTLYTALILAIIPTIIFIAHGLFLRHWLLVIFGILFGISHIFITYRNHRN